MYLIFLLNSNRTVSPHLTVSSDLCFASPAADRLHPRVRRHALPHVLAARVHPRPATTPAGLLLVRPLLPPSSAFLLWELARNVRAVAGSAVGDSTRKILT